MIARRWVKTKRRQNLTFAPQKKIKNKVWKLFNNINSHESIYELMKTPSSIYSFNLSPPCQQICKRALKWNVKHGDQFSSTYTDCNYDNAYNFMLELKNKLKLNSNVDKLLTFNCWRLFNIDSSMIGHSNIKLNFWFLTLKAIALPPQPLPVFINSRSLKGQYLSYGWRIMQQNNEKHVAALWM